MNINKILIKHLGPPIDDSHYDSIKSAMREFAQLQAKEAIEKFERYNEDGAPLDMDAVIKYIKLKFDIK